MAFAIDLDRKSAVVALQATVRTRPALLRRLAVMENLPQDDLTRDIVLTEPGRRHATGMVAKLLTVIDEVDGL